MVPYPPGLDLWQLAGSIIGSALAFLIAWPANRRDFFTRLGVSLICGMVFGPLVSDHFQWPDIPKFALAAATVCALFSWAAIGMVMRIIGTTNKLPSLRRQDTDPDGKAE